MRSMLYDETQLELLQRTGMRLTDADNKRRSYAQRLNRIGCIRDLVQIPRLSSFDKLDKEMPNFSEVTTYIRGQVALRKMGSVGARGMGLLPILLQGPPGIGKTRYAQQLAQVLKVAFYEVAFATTTAAFVLKGSSLQWGEGQPGRIFEILADSEHINPLVLLDEVDKSMRSSFPPINTLYELLEPSQSVRFQDEALVPLTLDASHIIWVLTANEPQLIPEAIVSRCRVFDVPIPSQGQVNAIAKSIYKEVLKGQPWAKKFESTLSDDVVDKLSAMPPREMRKVISEALGWAALSGLRAITVDAIAVYKPSRKIGF